MGGGRTGSSTSAGVAHRALLRRRHSVEVTSETESRLPNFQASAWRHQYPEVNLGGFIYL